MYVTTYKHSKYVGITRFELVTYDYDSHMLPLHYIQYMLHTRPEPNRKLKFWRLVFFLLNYKCIYDVDPVGFEPT